MAAAGLLTGTVLATPASASPVGRQQVGPAGTVDCFRQITSAGNGQAARSGPGLGFPALFTLRTGQQFDTTGPTDGVAADGIRWNAEFGDQGVWFPIRTTDNTTTFMVALICER
ncbi:MAG TPA: hypothetical protein VFX70_18815 [Mycobacteriales bacterium]|nr:hypothetical protein [Mycobacteriales bacterium]